MKSVSAWDLIARRGMNSTSYWLISTAHFTIRHVASFALENVCKWLIEYDPNGVRQEVVLELPSHHEYCVE
jgi:hypothetical protein